MATETFESLDVWKDGCRLAVLVYETLKDCRDYSLKDQMQRAAVSIPSNIAEGYERTPKDFIRFLVIAKGSAAELITQIYIADRVNVIDNETAKTLITETKKVIRMLQSLINYRRKQLP